MSTAIQRFLLIGIACLAICAWQTGRASAEEPKPAAEKPAADSPSEKDAADKAASKTDKELREQSIYIPYEKLRKVFEKEGRGVFLPYKEFQELWQAAREKTAPTAEPKPPVATLITEVENEATVSKDVVRVKASVKIDLLAEGWQEVGLGLSDAAITEAKLGDKPARLLAAGGGYKLLVEKKGKQPEQIVLSLEYTKAIARMPGQNSVSFQAPQAPVSRWRVRIPESGVKVNISPLIAATEVTDTVDRPVSRSETPTVKEETVVLAFVGAAPTVRIEWTPKAEGATGLEALASVQAEQQVSIEEGVVRTRTQLAYAISRAELSQLRIDVPADQKVVNVFDANVRQWSVAEAGGRQTITVQLFEPAKGSQNVTVELEKFAGQEAKQATVAVPVVKALSVGRQQGVVVVRVAEGIRSEVTKTSGLLQVDAAELPAALARTTWAYSYRYASVPFDLVVSTEKVQPRILADSLVEAELTPEALSLNVSTVYTVERAGVFRLEMDLPAGFEVRQVRGREVPGVQAAQVDTHHLEGEAKTRLVVNLARKAMGRVGLVVELHKDLQEADLLAPTGKAAEIPLPIPQVAAGTVERAAGRVMIYAPESLRVNPGKTKGVRSVSFKEALGGMASTRKAADARPVLAFAYTQEPTDLSLAAERRRPQVTIRQLLVARIEDGVVKYQATFFFNVLYSGVKSLRFDLPTEVAPLVRNNTPTIRDKVIDPPPKDLAKGYVAWSLAGESELIGEGKIELVWEKKIDKLDVGRSIDLSVPRLKPMDVDRAWGQIVLAKAETLDIREAGQPTGLRPIDPQHDLMPGAEVANAAAALEFHGDWNLGLTVTRYELQEVKQASIERAVLRMVVTRADKIPVQALYRLRSSRQRLVVRLPKDGKFDSEPRINGRPMALEMGENQQYFIPLTTSNADESFLLELRYTVPGNGRQFEIPEFPQEPAVQKVYLCAYLPKERTLLSRSGPWTEEFEWRLSGPLSWEPVARTSENDLLAWVSQGVNLGNTFPIDGQLYIFSALQPEPAPAGALRLSTWDEQTLTLAVIGLVALAGIVLLPARAGVRALALGAIVIALVLSSVFWPIFAWQVLDSTLAAAVFVVFVVWTIWYFLRNRPRNPFTRSVIEPATSQPSPAEQPAAPAAETPEGSQPEPPAQASQPATTAQEAAPPPVQTAEEQPRADRQEGDQSHA
jgi:hypothetical protein